MTARVNKRLEPAKPRAIGAADHRSCHVHSQFRVVALADDGLASGHARQGVQESELTPASVFRFALFSSLGRAATTADKTDRKLQLFWNVDATTAGMRAQENNLGYSEVILRAQNTRSLAAASTST